MDRHVLLCLDCLDCKQYQNVSHWDLTLLISNLCFKRERGYKCNIVGKYMVSSSNETFQFHIKSDGIFMRKKFGKVIWCKNRQPNLDKFVTPRPILGLQEMLLPSLHLLTITYLSQWSIWKKAKLTYFNIFIQTRQSIQWTPGYTIYWKLMKTILIGTKNSLIRT